MRWLWGAALAACALGSPAFAAFDYVPPPDPPALSVAEETAGALGETLLRLAPEGSVLAWDHRVDPGQPLDRVYGDWQSLLEGEGLAWTAADGVLLVHPASVSPARAAAAAPPPPNEPWRVVSGELLADVLDRWGSRAGVDIVWLTDRRWRLDESRAWEGTFLEAARQLLFALSHLPVAPVGELSASGRSLTVVHRGPRTAPEESP